jgi:hypothetical protein
VPTTLKLLVSRRMGGTICSVPPDSQVKIEKPTLAEFEWIRHNMAWTLIILAYLICVGLIYFFVFPWAMNGR